MTPRSVEVRVTQGPGEVFGIPCQVIEQVMVYSDTGEPCDVLAEHKNLAIVGYMVKLKTQFLNCTDVVPAGGLVREIDDTHVTLDGQRIQRDLFLQIYAVD